MQASAGWLRRLGEVRAAPAAPPPQATSLAGRVRLVDGVAWAVQAATVSQGRGRLPDGQRLATDLTGSNLSAWRLTALAVDMRRGQVLAHASARRIRLCLPRLARFLRCRRRRPHQESQVRAWLGGSASPFAVSLPQAA